MSVQRTQTVRRIVAAQTQVAHQRLHENPLLCRLTEPSISRIDYFAALQVFHAVFHKVEALRRARNLWPDLSIQAQCGRLDKDCAKKPARVDMTLTSDASLLGALYALHGSQFGGAVIRRNIEMALPKAPKAFFSAKGCSAQWKLLVEYLETYRNSEHEIHQIVSGADSVFEIMDVGARNFHGWELSA